MTIDEQVHEVRSGAGVFDLSGRRAVIRLRGADRVGFLQNLCSNDIVALGVNEGQENALLDKKSHVLAMFTVFRAAEALILVTENANAPVILSELERLHFSESVEFERVSEFSGALSLQGRDALRTCEAVFGADALPSTLGVVETRFGESEVMVLGGNSSGMSSYEIYVGDGGVAAVREALMGAGAIFVEDLAVFDVLRIESGIPRYGVDVDDSHMVMEVDRQRELISFTKGCFPGQEIVARIKSRGTARRLLRGLVFDGVHAFTLGQSFQFLGKEGGVLRSSCWSPTLGKTLAFAFLNKVMHLEHGAVQLTIDGQVYEAEVSALPFYFPEHLEAEAIASYQAGMQAFHLDDYALARDSFASAIEWNPHYIDAYEALGVTLERMELYDEALVHNRRFAELAPTAVMARANLSRLYMLKGMIKEAEDEQAKATAISMRLAARENQKAVSADEIEASLSAERDRRMGIFKQVLDLDPNDEVANFGLGKLSLEIDDLDTAVRCLAEVVDRNPLYSAAYPLLGEALKKSGRIDDARSRLQDGLHAASTQGDLMPQRAIEQLLSDLA